MHHPRKNTQPAKARRDDLVVQEMPDEVLVYDLKSHKAHCLNQTAAFVWNQCDGEKTPSEISVLMEKEWGKPVAEDVVWLALKQLSRADLLEERSGPGSRRNARFKTSGTPQTGSSGGDDPSGYINCCTDGFGWCFNSCSLHDLCQKIGSDLQCPTECSGFCGRCFDNAGCGQGGGYRMSIM